MKNRPLVFGLILCVLIVLILMMVSSNRRGQLSQPNLNDSKQAEALFKARRSVTRENSRNSKSEFQALKENILALLASDRPVDINKVYNELVPALVKLDPKAAAEFSQSPEAAKWRANLMMVVAQSWAKLNTDDAQEWVSNLPNPPDDPTERDTMVSYVTFAVADINPERAVQVLEQCAINKDRFEIMVENLAQQWADQGSLQPLIDLISKMPPSAERDGYFARIANAMARTDVDQATAIVSENISPGPAQIDAAITIVRQLAWNDKSLAREWVDSFPAGEIHDRALKEWAETVAKREGTN
jgi:hypothetical protein